MHQRRGLLAFFTDRHDDKIGGERRAAKKIECAGGCPTGRRGNLNVVATRFYRDALVVQPVYAKLDNLRQVATMATMEIFS